MKTKIIRYEQLTPQQKIQLFRYIRKNCFLIILEEFVSGKFAAQVQGKYLVGYAKPL